MTNIQYVTIPNFPNYKVSSEGIVYRIYNKKLKPLKGSINNNGTLTVTLRFNGKLKIVGVNHLVADLFIPNPKHYHFVRHKDGNKLNNSINNLEWCYNTLENSKIKCVDTGEIFNSSKEIADKYLTTNDYITSAIRTNRLCFGHKFIYT